MDYLQELRAYHPANEQEEGDLRLMLALAQQEPERLLHRENKLCHITASGFILNPTLDKTLMAYHNIYSSWAWTGGHADGDPDLPGVALREACEETGILKVRLLLPKIASLEVLTVPGHKKHGQWVSPHLHFNVSYLLLAPEKQALTIKLDENSDVRWLPLTRLAEFCTEPEMLPVYEKLIRRAKTVT